MPGGRCPLCYKSKSVLFETPIKGIIICHSCIVMMQKAYGAIWSRHLVSTIRMKEKLLTKKERLKYGKNENDDNQIEN